MMRTMRCSGILLTVAALTAAGCGGEPTDKAGGKGGDVRVLRLANANEEPGELAAYAREVERVSAGRLKIRFVNDWRRGDVDAETGIIADVRAGKVDLAWVGARAFKAEGVGELDPLVAPFQVTDYKTEQAVLGHPVARDMLDAVDSVGVQGVALLPGPLRRLAMREPWKGPQDLKGKRISAPAGIGSDAIAALGATPVVGGSQSKLKGLDGAEEHLPSFLGNFYMHEIPHVSAQAVWPRPLVVIAAPALWERLDADDRATLMKAGTTVVGPMLDDIRAADEAAVPKLCSQGAQFFEADLEALEGAVAPVIDGLRGDPKTARILASIEGMQAGEPAPLACEETSSPVKGGLPPGEYTWTLTKAGADDYGDELPAKFRAVITPGHMVMYVSVNGRPEEIGLEADYSTFKDRIDIDDGAITGRWRVDGKGNLHFSDIGPEPGDRAVFSAHTWRRVR